VPTRNCLPPRDVYRLTRFTATQAITVNSRVAAGAPPRVEGNNGAPDYEDETEL
jgi:hypothetical protein